MGALGEAHDVRRQFWLLIRVADLGSRHGDAQTLEARIDLVADQMNHRPRKTLGWQRRGQGRG
jgi:hypothetical protein